MTNEEKQRTREVLTQLKNQGYTGVSISFDGGGDSGSITGAKAFTGDFILGERYHQDLWQYEPEITEDLKNLGYEKDGYSFDDFIFWNHKFWTTKQ